MAEIDKKVLEERQADLQKRIEGFNAELIPLLGKWELGLGAEPFMARTPQGVYVTLAKPIMLDDKKYPEDKVAEASAEKKSELASSAS